MFNQNFGQYRQGGLLSSGYTNDYRDQYNSGYNPTLSNHGARHNAGGRGFNHSNTNQTASRTSAPVYSGPSSKLCIFFQQGKCYNQKCRFRHDLSSSNNKETASTSVSSKEAAVKPKESNATNSSSSEKVQSKGEAELGEKEEKPHFCKDCNIDCKTAKGYQGHTRGMLHTQKVMNNSKEGDKSQSPKKPTQTQTSANPQRDTENAQKTSEESVQKTSEETTQKTSEAGPSPSSKSQTQSGGGTEADEYYCGVCQLHCQNSKAYQNHTRGLIHTQKVMEMEKKEGKDIYPEDQVKAKSESVKQGMKKTIQGTFTTEDIKVDNDYLCKVCECVMNSIESYEQHIEGARHKSNENNRSKGVPLKRGRTAKHKAPLAVQPVGVPRVQPVVDKCERPVIGLQHMTEFVTESLSVEPRYVCNMCEMKCDTNSLIPHCTGHKHRLNYMKEHFMNYYTQVRHKNVRRAELSAIVENLAEKIEQEEGRKQIKQVVIEDEKMLEKNAENLKKILNAQGNENSLTNERSSTNERSLRYERSHTDIEEVSSKRQRLDEPSNRYPMHRDTRADSRQDSYSKDYPSDFSQDVGTGLTGAAHRFPDRYDNLYPSDIAPEVPAAREPRTDPHASAQRHAYTTNDPYKPIPPDPYADLLEDDLLRARERAIDPYADVVDSYRMYAARDPYGRAAADPYRRDDILSHVDPVRMSEILPRDPYVDPRAERLASLDPYPSEEILVRDMNARASDPYARVPGVDPTDPYRRSEVAARDPYDKDRSEARASDPYATVPGVDPTDPYRRSEVAARDPYDKDRSEARASDPYARVPGVDPTDPYRRLEVAARNPYEKDQFEARASDPYARVTGIDPADPYRRSEVQAPDPYKTDRSGALLEDDRYARYSKILDEMYEKEKWPSQVLPERQAECTQSRTGMMVVGQQSSNTRHPESGRGSDALYAGRSSASDAPYGGRGYSDEAMYRSGQLQARDVRKSPSPMDLDEESMYRQAAQSTTAAISSVRTGPDSLGLGTTGLDSGLIAGRASHDFGSSNGRTGVGRTDLDSGVNVGRASLNSDLRVGRASLNSGISVSRRGLDAADAHYRPFGMRSDDERSMSRRDGSYQQQPRYTPVEQPSQEMGSRTSAVGAAPEASRTGYGESRREKQHVSVSESKTAAAGLVEGIDISSMIGNLSQCLVNTEEDASMALQVSNALTQALIQYRIKNAPQTIPPP